MFTRLTFAFLILFASFWAHAEPLPSPLSSDYIPVGADVALIVKNAQTGELLYQHRADTQQQPASVQKLITALAAGLYLDNDYRFETRLETDGDDVIINFSGDPTFTHSDLRRLIDKLSRERQVINGNFYLNGGVFDQSERAIGLPWDIMGVCYSAPSSSISMNGNCLYGKLHSPSGEPLIDLQATANDEIDIRPGNVNIREGLEHLEIDCDLKLHANELNQYRLDGCVGAHELPVNFHLAIQNPTLYVSQIVKEELDRAGIKLKGELRRHDGKRGEPLATNRSARLHKLIEEMLQDSDNLIADNILKTLGRLYYQLPGSYENGEAAVKAILKDEAGIDLETAILHDGSGLSRNNRVTAKQMLAVVEAIYQRPELGLMQHLPVSGESGTLAWRSSMIQIPLKGQIRAKTGSLYGVRNLAGQITARSGQDLLFVQLVTHHHADNKKTSRNRLRLFEKHLYLDLFNRH